MYAVHVVRIDTQGKVSWTEVSFCVFFGFLQTHFINYEQVFVNIIIIFVFYNILTDVAEKKKKKKVFSQFFFLFEFS